MKAGPIPCSLFADRYVNFLSPEAGFSFLVTKRGGKKLDWYNCGYIRLFKRDYVESSTYPSTEEEFIQIMV
jgi:hypothetical protein